MIAAHCLPTTMSEPKPTLFPPTRWSLVAGSRQRESSGKALSELCEIYWYPVYAYIRSMGKSHHDAQDLTQSFLAYFLDRGDFKRANKDRGRMRTFLCVAVKRYVISDDRRENCFKRGGDTVTISFDAEQAEFLYRTTPCDGETPETNFDRRWATALLQEATNRLESEYGNRGKQTLFAAIHPYLSHHTDRGSQEKVAARLDMGIGAFRMAITRLRQRYGEILRETVADTLTDPSEVESEIAYLLQLFAR